MLVMPDEVQWVIQPGAAAPTSARWSADNQKAGCKHPRCTL